MNFVRFVFLYIHAATTVFQLVLYIHTHVKLAGLQFGRRAAGLFPLEGAVIK